MIYSACDLFCGRFILLMIYSFVFSEDDFSADDFSADELFCGCVYLWMCLNCFLFSADDSVADDSLCFWFSSADDVLLWMICLRMISSADDFVCGCV